MKERIDNLVKTIKEFKLKVIVFTDGHVGRTMDDRRVFIKKSYTLEDIEKTVDDVIKFLRPALPTPEFTLLIDTLKENELEVVNYI